ncbi:Icarapin-like [Frankliniella fusca]|uniref:Icarapin-like n=1 Tax=Frankliniella fusca TaxID=407009 RepID=A0AAE1LCK9_9NEOP|nr:Icarapin-like [Frankliniella fusca]
MTINYHQIINYGLVGYNLNEASFGSRPARQESNPDRDVEVVEPVNTGAGSSRSHFVPPESESPEEIPFAFGIPVRRIGSFGGLGGVGLGARPILVRPLGVHPVLAARDDSDEASSEEDGGFIRPYFTDPMNNFMIQMAEMMAAMRREMAEVLSRGGGSSRDGVPDFTKLGNTTSTTKVIDGHVITVNETVIEGEGEEPELHIRVIDVHPSEAPESEQGHRAGQDDSKDAETVESTASDSEAVTPTADRSENEIPMKVGSEVDDLNLDNARSARSRARPSRDNSGLVF